MIRFNISPSSLNVYNESPLMFFYQQIAKAKDDTKTPQCYGRGGTAVHEILDRVAKNNENLNSWESQFDKIWHEEDLYYLPDLKGKPLEKPVYKECVIYGLDLIKNKYEITDPELNIQIPFKNDGKHKINFKGKIDCVGFLKGTKKKIIMDYKTSSSMDSDQTFPGEPYSQFRLQGMFYAWLIYKERGFVVDEVIFEYLKLKKPKSFKPTLKDLQDFEKYLYMKGEEIVSKGNIIDNYDIGKIDSIFNGHKLACEKERSRRLSKQTLIVERGKDNVCTIKTKIYDSRLLKALKNKYSYECGGTQFSLKFQDKVWDGKKYLFRNNQFPFPFWNNINKFLSDFNKYFNTNYEFDLRQPYLIDEIVNVKYDTKFKDLPVEPRFYQTEAKDVSIKEKIGINYLGTSGGKTIISAMIIKEVNKRFLFVVNRIELVRQTKKEFEKILGVEIGEMSEGNIDVNKQITVASIQTINAILERKDQTSIDLRRFLYNVNGIIYDEAQTLSDSSTPKKDEDGKKKKNTSGISMYGKLGRTLTNCEYFLGMSGSPHRRTNYEKIYGDDSGEVKKTNNTLEMNALVGFVIYSMTTKQLEELGYITPTKCYFIDYTGWQDFVGVNYHDYYTKNLTNNTVRNDLIMSIIEKFRDTKKSLILTKRIEHGEILSSGIEDSFFINGSTNKKKRQKNFEEFKNSRGKVLVGSSQIFSAGIDIPDLDLITFAGGGKSDIEVVQSVGRVKRLAPNKKFGYFIDFCDRSMKYFDESAEIRMEILEDYGNEVKVVTWEQFVKEMDEVEKQ
jgi:superfamily II DNA or RNA helicase